MRLRFWIWIPATAVLVALIGIGFLLAPMSARYEVTQAPPLPGSSPEVEFPDFGSVAPESSEEPEQAFPAEEFLEPMPSESPVPQANERVDPIEEALREQAWAARAAIEAEEHMGYRDRRQARLHIQRGEAAEIDDLAPHPVFDRVVDMTSEVQATVDATPHLKVTPKSPEWQTIRTNAPTSWTWDVEAVEEGNGSLTFTLRQKVLVDGQERIVAVREFPHTVEITIGFAARAWRSASTVIDYVAARWAFFTGIGAAAASFLAWLGRGRLIPLWPSRQPASAKPDIPEARGKG